jgi:hypothetical protein
MDEHRRMEIYTELHKDFENINRSLNIYGKTELDDLLWKLSKRVAELSLLHTLVNATDRHPLDMD